MKRRTAILATSVALMGATTFAVAGPTGGHAWGTSHCVITDFHGYTKSGGGSFLCATSSASATAVAVAKPGQSASASASGNQVAVAVNCAATTTVNRVVYCP